MYTPFHFLVYYYHLYPILFSGLSLWSPSYPLVNRDYHLHPISFSGLSVWSISVPIPSFVCLLIIVIHCLVMIAHFFLFMIYCFTWWSLPIGSMYGIFAYICLHLPHKSPSHVGKYTSTIVHMAYVIILFMIIRCFFLVLWCYLYHDHPILSHTNS